MNHWKRKRRRRMAAWRNSLAADEWSWKMLLNFWRTEKKFVASQREDKCTISLDVVLFFSARMKPTKTFIRWKAFSKHLKFLLVNFSVMGVSYLISENKTKKWKCWFVNSGKRFQLWCEVRKLGNFIAKCNTPKILDFNQW